MSRSSRSRPSEQDVARPLPLEQENIVDVDVSLEMETSFLEYAYSVIYSRALPDARDGPAARPATASGRARVRPDLARSFGVPLPE